MVAIIALFVILMCVGVHAVSALDDRMVASGITAEKAALRAGQWLGRHPWVSYLAAAILVGTFALWSGTANAQSATSARQGTVLTIQAAEQTSSQAGYGSYQQPYQQQSYQRATVGGVIGGLVGAIATRNSRSVYRYEGGAAGAAIGAAIGYAADRRADQRQTQRAYAAQEQARYGAQVIVKLDDGQTVAVFSHSLAGIYPGSRVWLVGNQELIPAN